MRNASSCNPACQKHRCITNALLHAAFFFSLDFCSRSLCEIELSQQFVAHFAGLIFQKCSGVVSLLTSWHANRVIAAILLRFLWATFRDRAGEPPKQRPYFGDPRCHITRKNAGFGAKSDFTNYFTREFVSFRTITLPSYLTRRWHDDVVVVDMIDDVADMIVEEMLTMSIVRNSDVF